MKNPLLKSKNIYLRALVPEDANGNYPAWLNDEKISAYNSHHTFGYTKEQALEYINSSIGSRANLILAITDIESNRHIGNVALQNINWINRSAEFAILIGESDFHKKGVGKEAMSLILDHGFSALNLHRIYCGTPVENSSMRSLAQFFNMREEGLRKEAFYKNSSYHDIVEYGLLRGEYYEHKNRQLG